MFQNIIPPPAIVKQKSPCLRIFVLFRWVHQALFPSACDSTLTERPPERTYQKPQWFVPVSVYARAYSSNLSTSLLTSFLYQSNNLGLGSQSPKLCGLTLLMRASRILRTSTALRSFGIRLGYVVGNFLSLFLFGSFSFSLSFFPEQSFYRHLVIRGPPADRDLFPRFPDPPSGKKDFHNDPLNRAKMDRGLDKEQNGNWAGEDSLPVLLEFSNQENRALPERQH